MTIKFDDAVADKLIEAASYASTELTNQAPTRRDSAEDAMDDFEGAYAGLFETNCGTESSDRSGLAGKLDTLIDQVGIAKDQAAKEKERAEKHAQWEMRQVVAAQQSSWANPSAPSYQTPGSNFPWVLDPEPNNTPHAAPTVSIAATVQQRTRFASGGGGGRASADPVQLDSWVSSSRAANGLLVPKQTELSTAWSNFTDSCAWVDCGGSGFIEAFQMLIDENGKDADWLEHIAQAFEQAGSSGDLTDLYISLAVDPQYLKNLLTSKDLTAEQLADAMKYANDHPELAGEIGEIVAGQVKALDKGSSYDDVDTATALLHAFAQNPALSDEILNALTADTLVQQVSLAGWYMQYSDPVRAQALADGLKAVFQSGETHMADTNPRDSADFATALVMYLDSTDRGSSPQSGNDGYSLSFLLRDSTLSTPFLGEMGEQLNAFERGIGPYKREDWEGQFSWAGLAGGPDNRANYLGLPAEGAMRLFDDDAFAGGYDPVASYMSALHNNGEAAYQFFTDTADTYGSYPSESLEDRMDYWVRRRKWGHDDFNGILGALDAAVATKANVVAHPEETSGMVSSLVEMFADRTDGQVETRGADGEVITDSLSFGRYFGSGDEKFDAGNLGPQATVSLAHILGEYMPAVEYYTTHAAANPPHMGLSDQIDMEGVGPVAAMPVFSKVDLDVIVKAGLSNEEGFDALRQSVSNYQNYHFSRLIKENYGSPDFNDKLLDAANADAALEGFFSDKVGEVSIDSAKDKDERIKIWIGLGEDLFGVVPFGEVASQPFVEMMAGNVPVGKVIAPLVESGTDYGAGQLLESYTGTLPSFAEAAKDSSEAYATEALSSRKNAIVGTLFDGKVIDVDWLKDFAEDEKLDYAEEIDEWFKDGSFPEADTIRNDNQLQIFIDKIAEDSEVRFNVRQDYNNTYKLIFLEHFGKP